MHTFSAAYFSPPYSGCILYVCTFFHTPARRHKMYTQGSPAACCRQKVHILPGHPLRPPAGYTSRRASLFAARSAYTRLSSFRAIICIHKPPLFSAFFSYFLKSAYTSRTPGTEPQPAKSVHTSLPRFVCKKYAYKAAPASLLIVKKCIH